MCINKKTTMGRFIMFILSTLAIFSCSVEDASNDSSVLTETGILVDMSKFDGCGWGFKYDDNTLEPTNLSKFNITPVDSMPVGIRYVLSDNQTSTCMIGTVIALIDIWNLNE